MAIATHDLAHFISPSEAARRLGLSYQRVNQLTRAGRLPVVKTVLGCLIAEEDVERLAVERSKARGEDGEKLMEAAHRVVAALKGSR